MKKIPYRYIKWYIEILLTRRYKKYRYNNIRTTIDLYLRPETLREEVTRNVHIDDPASFYHLLGFDYFLLANNIYLMNKDAEAAIGYLYLYVKGMARSYELAASGVKITNCAIETAYSQKRDLENISFAAAAIGRLELFEKYGDCLGCELIKAMYHGDHDKARQLVEELPDTEEMYEKYKLFESYYYGSRYMKDLYVSILNRDEKAFNNALIRRLKNVRTGYVTPIDIVSLSMIRFAKKAGLECKIKAIEIPKAFLADDLFIDDEKYKLIDVT